MALYNSRGRICEMSEVKSGTSQSGFEWQRMTLTLEIPGFQGSVIKQVFSVSNEAVNEVMQFNIGDKVEVSWSMYARAWNGRLYNNVDLVKIKFQEDYKAAPAAAPAPAPSPALQELTDNKENDLPW